jgi:hypothetical protein
MDVIKSTERDGRVTFEEAYGQSGPFPKTSWLSRVASRASHISASKNGAHLSLIAPINASPSHSHRSPTPSHRSPIPSPIAAPGQLPLRAVPTSDFADTLQQQLEDTYRKTSLDDNPPFARAHQYSPSDDTDFVTTPIDANFGDRVEQRDRDRDPPPPDRPPPDVLHASNPVRSGSSTKLRDYPPAVEARESSEDYRDGRSSMDKYARAAGDNTYDSDAEADDEFERSVFNAPNMNQHYDDHTDHPSDSDDDHSVMDGDDTPTTQAWVDRDGRSPTGKVLQWTEEEVADYIASLSPALKQYGQRFVEEGVNGEALIALNHDELREIGIASVGHRLTILKAVYEQKLRTGVRIEEGDYVPLSAEGEKSEMNATQDDITRIIESIKLRDQRIIAAEVELRALKDNLDRIADENRKLREETLPIMRMMKDHRSPLPDPSGGQLPSPREADGSRDNLVNQSKGSSLSRKFSTKKLFLKNTDNSKQQSPTHPPYHSSQREVRDDGGTHLEASAAAMAASSHLTASMSSQTSPNSVHGSQLSPTSPAYSTHQPPNSAATRSFPQHRDRAYGHDNDSLYANNQYNQSGSVMEKEQPSARSQPQQDRSRRQAPTPSPREDEPPSAARDKDNPQVEIFKSFRVSIEDPCRVVLPVVSARHGCCVCVCPTGTNGCVLVCYRLSNDTTSRTIGGSTPSTSFTAIKSGVWVWRRNRCCCSNSWTRRVASPCSCSAAMLLPRRGGAIPVGVVLPRSPTPR